MSGEVPSRLATLSSQERSKLLRKLNAERRTAAAPLPPADRGRPLPLSFAQRRLWFLRRLEGLSCAYNMPAAFRLRGALDSQAVASALHEIARRHEVLRTRLTEQDGEPFQVIDPPEADPGGARVRMLSLAGLPPSQREDELRALLREHARHPFDLEREHPFRCLLVELAAEDHVLAINVDHIASDGWSSGVLIREFAALYNASSAGRPNPLPALPLQYAEYALWQRRELDDEAKVEAQLRYWRDRLAGAPGVINLPAESPRRASSGAAGESVLFRIDAGHTRAAAALARDADASLYMVLLAAFYILLNRWSGDTDITVGTPVANRPRPEFEALIGFFVNTLALRVTLDDDPAFRILVQRVRGLALEAYGRADLPFEQLVERLNPVRHLDRSPFFDVMFAMQGGAAEEVALDGVRVESLPISTGAARFDLTLSLQESLDGLQGCLEFSTAIFRPETAQRFVEHYRNVLASAVRDPQRPLSELAVLGESERHRLLVEWNRTDLPLGQAHCVHELVEAQARLTPDATAVRFGDASWTYRRLIEESGRIAGLLREHGIGPDALVGVCLERTPMMIAALLGVLRAGGAYVALDPAYPAARIRSTLADSGAPVVLASRGIDPELFAPAGAADAPEIVLLDDRADEPPAPFVPGPVRSSNLAYVLYTSGSTGRPKGVAVEHRNAVAFLQWARSVWSLEELRGVLAGTSICFDLSVFELFLPLSAGGAVVLAANVLELPALACRESVTLVNTVPSAIDALLAQDGLPRSVRVVNLAGEPLSTELADRVLEVPSVTKLYDLYGPSEATTYATFTRRRRGDPPSIGRPIANTRLYILDGALEPVPVGVPGEICLAGEGLARGYLGQPALTAERFVPNPFLAGDRLYRTGDRGRFRSDGSVEFLGRLDHQVKLRGFRIEPGEIEAVLRECAGVSNAVVMVQETSAGSDRLTAYVVHAAGASIVPELQAQLRSRLPEYMVPALILVLDALPLTANGKIDRAALRAFNPREAARESGPLTPAESLLAGIWISLLHCERAGREDDFFALGGHSLLAARLVSLVAKELGVDLPLRAVFEHPTLAGQAAEIARFQRTPVASVDAPIPRLAPHEQRPLSFAQERLWFLDQLEPGSTAYNMSGAIRLLGALDVPALQAAFARVVERHEVLRTAFPTIAGRAVAVEIEGLPGMREVDLRPLPEAERRANLEASLREDAGRAFDLARGPLIRATLLRVTDEESVLAVSMHHIVSDGWSIDLFLNELCARYAGAEERRADAAIELQYADVAAWQRRRFAEGIMAPDLDYWRQRLAGAPPLDLPTDHPRPEAQAYRGATFETTIDAPLAALLSRRTREIGVTTFMALVAAFGALLRRWSGQDDLVIGFPAAGRTRSELEPLIGLFVNTLPLRLQFAPAISFEALLGEVRARTLEALSHQELPFEKLVDALGVERSLARSPLFGVMFVMQNVRPPAALPAGLRAEPYATPASTQAKYDLTLAVADHGDHLSAAFEYDPALFEAPTIAHLAAEFVELLRRALTAPGEALPAGEAPVRERVVPPPPALAPPGTATTAVEIALAEVWREVLRLERVGVNENFFELGGDSIVSIRVIAALRERGWRVEPRQIFRHQTIRALAAVAEPVDGPIPAEEDEAGSLALTPMQRLFFEANPPSPSHFNQALLLVLDPAAEPAALRLALREVQRVHPALRSRFRHAAAGWSQEIVADLDLELEEHDLSAVRPEERGAALERRANAIQRSLDVTGGPIVRTALFRLGPAERRLLLVAHHLVVDAVSWQVLLADLETAYAQARRGEQPSLPLERCGPTAFRRRLAARCSDGALAQERGYWASIASCAAELLGGVASREAERPLPESITATLSAEETRSLLTDVHRAHRTSVPDLLLAALGRALCELTKRESVVVDVEGHGRDALSEADLSRSVGWFTTLYPVALRCGLSTDSASTIRAVKESLHSVPNGGIGFGLLHWTAGPLPAAHTDVCFNYLGQTRVGGGALFRALASEGSGDHTAADLPRRYRLDCNAAIVDGSLVMHYSFDARSVNRATVADLAERTRAVLRALIAECLGELEALLDDLDLSELSGA